MAKLTLKQQRFVDEYLMEPVGARAARRAGYAGDAQTLAQVAHENLRKPDIRKAVEAGLAELKARAVIEQDEVLLALRRQLQLDIRDAYDAEGCLLPISELPVEVARCVQSIEVEELYEGHGDERVAIGRVRKVKFTNRDKALELALRHKGLLNDKLQVKGELTLEQLLREALQPAQGGT